MERVVRDQPITPEEAARYQAVREQVAADLSNLIARHRRRMATAQSSFENVFAELKALRVARTRRLSELRELTEMDRSTLTKLEAGRIAIPTVGTLQRYAKALGKRVVVTLEDE